MMERTKQGGFIYKEQDIRRAYCSCLQSLGVEIMKPETPLMCSKHMEYSVMTEFGRRVIVVEAAFTLLDKWPDGTPA